MEFENGNTMVPFGFMLSSGNSNSSSESVSDFATAGGEVSIPGIGGSLFSKNTSNLHFKQYTWNVVKFSIKECSECL